MLDTVTERLRPEFRHPGVNQSSQPVTLMAPSAPSSYYMYCLALAFVVTHFASVSGKACDYRACGGPWNVRSCPAGKPKCRVLVECYRHPHIIHYLTNTACEFKCNRLTSEDLCHARRNKSCLKESKKIQYEKGLNAGMAHTVVSQVCI